MDTRSFLLGGFAVLIAGVGAQAAELPVKAKPVEYVKACTLYGDGFYYIPGTQTCMKIGGFVRAEIKYDAIGSFEPANNGANAQFFRGGDVIDTRVRAGISFDAREQTAYGTLRAYFLGGWQYTSNDAPTLSLPGTAYTRASSIIGYRICAPRSTAVMSIIARRVRPSTRWSARPINSARAARIGRPGKSDRAPYGIRPGASTSASTCNTRRSARPHLPAAP